MGDTTTDTKFKDDHLVLPVATPLPHHTHNIKSGYQHDVLNSAGLHHSGTTTDDLSSLHMAAHNRFLMGAGGPGSGGVNSLDPHHFATSATNPFAISRFLPGGSVGNLTDPKTADVVSHYDYGQLAGTPTTHGGTVGGQFGTHVGSHESSMYYPPPLYPVHPTSTSVHSNHLWWWDNRHPQITATTQPPDIRKYNPEISGNGGSSYSNSAITATDEGGSAAVSADHGSSSNSDGLSR